MAKHYAARNDHKKPLCELAGLSLAGLSADAKGSCTAQASAEVECDACRVASDQLQDAGDLFLNEEGLWELDERPAEYRSVYSFVEYLTEDERQTFTLPELQELVRLTNQSFRRTLLELVRLGFRMEQPKPPPEVRGIGRLKPARRDS